MATNTRERAKAHAENADKRARAVAKYQRVSPRKAKIVIDLIRGKQVDQAAAILQFTPKAASPLILKVLNSAVANAENNLELSREGLYVAECHADPGPSMKRYWARSRGSASPVLKRSCHITVVLGDKAAGK